MAVLSQIRQRSVLLIVVIGLSLLAFIVGDILRDPSFKSNSKYVGSVNGTDIPADEFNLKVNNIEKNGQGVTATQAVNQVWEQEVSVALISEQFEKLGIKVGNDHIVEAMKMDQNVARNPAFLDDKGMFDINKYNEYFKANPQANEFKNDIQKSSTLNAKAQMYYGLVRGGLFVTDLQGKFKYQAENDKVTFDYVAMPYSAVKDSEVKISDNDILAYMKKDEKRWKAEENREIEYVVLEDKPSDDDNKEMEKNINELLAGKVVYNKTTNTNDTLPGFRAATDNRDFVNANSDIPYDSTYIAKKDLPAQFADALYNLPVGEVYGPYLFNGHYNLSKMVSRKSNAAAKASHILISWEGTKVPNKKEVRTKEQAKAKAEQLLAQVKNNPAAFQVVAITSSDDSSGQQGGDLGYFQPNQMVKPFNDFVFNNPVGTIGLVETEFGYHIINITDKQDGVRLATIAQVVEPSEATTDKSYTDAVKFEMEATDKDFATVAKNEKLPVNPSLKLKHMDETVGNMGAQRAIVRWAFDKATKVGDVKKFDVTNVGYAIVKLKKVNEAGLTPIDEARLQVEPLLKNQKKAELIRKKMTGSTLEAMAAANNTTVQQAVDLTLANSSLPNAGPEPKVVGTAFGSAPNKLSAPIDGTSGVYAIVTKSVTKAPALKLHTDGVDKVKQQVQGFANRVLPALKAEADIKDKRSDFNY